VASRRHAEALLRAGRITCNGVVVGLGDRADPARDRLAVDGRPVALERPVYWILHKPRGVVSTTRDPEGRPTVLSLALRAAGGARLPRLYPVGRLDRDSEGLVLLTNDGALTQVLLHPSHGSEREYRVVVRGPVGRPVADALRAGVELEEGRSAPARVERLRWNARAGTSELTLVLIEGRKRQIRRSLAALGHPVLRLVRVRVGPLRLGRLAAGAARELRPDEVRALREHAHRLARAREDTSRPRVEPRRVRA
jgi:23S rRNA pseudouridine2605 synthase